MTHPCPEGHASTAADFCSVCGAEIRPTVAAPQPPSPAEAAKCPDCDAPRETPFQVFCELCGYNYRTGASGQGKGVVSVTPRKPAAAPNPTPAPAASHPDNPPAPAGPEVRWDVVVKVDANLYGKVNPDAPADQPTQTFTLFDEENVIGRGGQAVRVQVPILADPGVSRRQAVLLRLPDGGLIVRDLNSANGTQLNGKELLPGVDAPVQDGDAIAVGAWTRIAVRAVVG